MSDAYFVYVIGPDAGPQKIGVALNPQRRLLQFQTSVPYKLNLWASVPIAEGHARRVEIRTHRLLRAKHMHGEWFDVLPAEAEAAVIKAAGSAQISGEAVRMSGPGIAGRRKQWSEDMQARFAAGTFARVAAVLVDGEDRTDFVRAAVDAELKRRERAAQPDARKVVRERKDG